MREHFLEKQWQFLAPVFYKNDENNFMLDLEPQHILPFTWKSGTSKRGTFSEVDSKVAIKEIINTNDAERESAETEFELEAKALKDLCDLNHQHIIQHIAAIKRGSRRYFMFQWADGGSLRDLWKSKANPTICAPLVKEIIQQLRGLADALKRLHYYKEDQGSYRHGDLKPENILVFRDDTDLGRWKVADMGLAKHHDVVTELRPPTSTIYGSVRYEAPEIITKANTGRSRLYDIWSMGCIILELMIWLLYGYDELVKFNRLIKHYRNTESSYFLLDGSSTEAKLQPEVIDYMDRMARDLGEIGRNSLSDLLGIVRDKMLVIALPEHTEPSIEGENTNISVTPADTTTTASPPSRFRATAIDICDSLDEILGTEDIRQPYWSTVTSLEGMRGPASITPVVTHGNLLSPTSAAFPRTPRRKLSLRSMATSSSGHGAQQDEVDSTRTIRNLDKIWEFSNDNDFANDTISKISTSGHLSWTPKIATLCIKCQKLEFWVPLFTMKDTLPELQEQSKSCDFCKMRWDLSKHIDPKEASVVYFDRVGSNLRMNEGYPPVLTISRSRDSSAPDFMRPIQVGYPELQDAGSNGHIQILSAWLNHCEANHPMCQPPKDGILPTRLIEVGTKGSQTIKLYDTKETDSMKYIALSHPWGDPPHFCTLQSNVREYTVNIEMGALPITFQDAVTTTRELGFQYLWIDSICIIQGPDGDFNKESKRMEDVFSSAVCVIAASSAKNQRDGFLRREAKRDYVPFVRDGLPPLFISSFIDDFNQHAVESSLNKRGWVLQERALARRTIYFTEHQTYWECGEGVRCETLAKMNNKLASFTGDPNFPEVALQYTKGGKIRLYQALYSQYSRLAFTRSSDRAIGIAGLEKRLARAFDTKGGFGVFDNNKESFFHRSLLWLRGSDELSLSRITFPAELQMTVPSWSWMAYTGGIDYLDPPFDGMEWEQQNIQSPWFLGTSDFVYTAGQAGVCEIGACASDFVIKDFGKGSSRIVNDMPNRSDGPGPSVKCVVIGRQKGHQPPEQRTHYVVLVSHKHVAGGKEVYERVGVGYMPGY
ncbi:hypothetical protein F5B20DRAFT_581016 [Whalleya microplaca]|nr:hypothetical protein F5B20DRAFT_581016 [Whalleya microplaca]